MISTLFMSFNLYGLVIAWIQEAHNDVRESKRWWFRNKASIDILRMRNDAETILKSQVPFVPSLYCPWNDSMNMCRACHLQNPQHATHLLNSRVGHRIENNCWTNDKYDQHTISYCSKYGILLYMTFYSWVTMQNTLSWNITIILPQREGVQQCEGYK